MGERTVAPPRIDPGRRLHPPTSIWRRTMLRIHTRRSFAHTPIVTAVLLAACGGGGPSDPSEQRQAAGGVAASEQGGLLKISVLSSRPYLVSGGDALVQVAVPPGLDLARVRVLRNGADVTAKLAAQGHKLIGVIDGLALGDNTVSATFDGRRFDTLTLTNHPRTGPMISGPHEQPFFCRTTAFTTNLPAGTNLGAPLDENCSVATRWHYMYRRTDNTFAQLPDPSVRPADLAFTTTNAGRTVPYIVRIETGTINRAIYQTAILHDPGTDAPPSPTTPPAGWNRKLIYPLGGGCQGGWYTQASSLVNPLNDFYLSNGFGVASATLNTFGNNCNDLLSSETILMVKERFVESYGVPLFTIGTGSSGGAYQSNHTADNYPGTFDGIVTMNSFPDVTTGMVGLGDARLLDIYFNTTRAGMYTVDQQKAISGFRQVNEIAFLSDRTGTSGTSARRMDPRQVFQANSVQPGVGLDFRYDPVTNPVGARATVYDHTVNVYGRIPGTPGRGFSKRPLDNVGVQYGLKALNDGVINVDQFIDLNRMIGGFDIDLNHIPERTTAHLDATSRAYRTGRILWGGNGLANIPIITRHGYGDGVVNGDIHLKFWSFAIRERLMNANGRTDNQVIVGQLANSNSLIEQMNRWLDAIVADPSQRPAIEKVVRSKPADVVDACFTSDGTKIVETQTAFGPGQCNALFPTSMSPNLVAGSPIASDVIKCQLKPLTPADYNVTFTPSQWQALGEVFPQGVCDWSRPGVEQTPSQPWASVGPSPVNRLFDVSAP
jgi:hypothetical protein